MTRQQWIDDFTANLWALMAIGGQGTIMAPSSGDLVFGGYAVRFASQRGDGDRSIRVYALQDTPTGQAMAVDGASWSATLDDDPMPIADDVAQWIRPRWRG